jgi:hypothetical protein
MHKFLLAAAATLTFGATAHAEGGMGVGKYVWNKAESHYEAGFYATEQTMIIHKNDATGINVEQTVTPVGGGKTFSWHIDAPYDDQMRHGSQWMSFAFTRISDNQFHDRYIMDDTKEEGAETFTIKDKKLILEGSSVHNGKKMTYVEVWDKVE